MGTGRKLNKAPKTRPKKNPRERRRREASQRARLIDLGMEAETVRTMTSKDVRQKLQRPLKTVAEIEKARS
jgi:hypothetical protein